MGDYHLKADEIVHKATKENQVKKNEINCSY